MTRPFKFIVGPLCAALLASCAALPDDSPVVEQLDDETGVTIARLGRPIELYRETFVQDASGRFAFVGPFETNQMGARELYLWVAVPTVSPPEAEPLAVEVNGQTLSLGAPGRSADFAGLRSSPYKIPTPWSAMYYYKVDTAVVATLGEARSVTVRVTEAAKEGSIRVAFATRVDGPRLKEFAARQ